MTAVVRMEIAGAAELARALAIVPDVARRELLGAMWESEFLLQREVQERTPTAIGAGGGLRGSILAREPQVLGDTILGAVATSLAYAAPVELGTRPHFPPIQPLRDWVEHKLGIPETESRSVAYRIALKISRVGTEGAFMFRDGLAATERQILAIFTAAHGRIIDAMKREGR